VKTASPRVLAALLLDQQHDRMMSASQSIESMFRAMRAALEDIQSGKVALPPQ
jgi:hypothetical protein